MPDKPRWLTNLEANWVLTLATLAGLLIVMADRVETYGALAAQTAADHIMIVEDHAKLVTVLNLSDRVERIERQVDWIYRNDGGPKEPTSTGK